VTLRSGNGFLFLVDFACKVLHKNLLVMMNVLELVLGNARVKLFVLGVLHLH
jgi:hypothetical protein